MNHLGELISLVVAVSWTITAWFADKSSRHLKFDLPLKGILLGIGAGMRQPA